jgi:hypothetical protein
MKQKIEMLAGCGLRAAGLGLVFAALLALLALPAGARENLPGVYQAVFNGVVEFGGGATSITGGTTNFYLTQVVSAATGFTNAVPTITWHVSGHPNCGLAINYSSFTNTATNGSNIFKLVRSYDDGATYEGTPFLLLTNVLPTAAQMAAEGGAFTNCSLFDLVVPNATDVGMVEIDATGTNYALTNVQFNLHLGDAVTYTYPLPR